MIYNLVLKNNGLVVYYFCFQLGVCSWYNNLLRAGWSRDQIPETARFSTSVPTGPGGPTHPPIQWVLGHSWGQTAWGMALTTHPHLKPRLKKSTIISLFPLCAFMGSYRVNSAFFTCPIFIKNATELKYIQR